MVYKILPTNEPDRNFERKHMYAKYSYIYCELKIKYTSNDRQNSLGLNVKQINRIVVWRLKEHELRRNSRLFVAL